MSEEKVVTVRMPEAMHRELKEYCTSTSRSMNGVITKLIQAKLSMVEPKERDVDASAGYKFVGGFKESL